MLERTRVTLAAIAIATFVFPALAQTPDRLAPTEPAPQTTPEAAPAPCGERLELLIGSVTGQFADTKPTTEAQRRALDAFKSAADKARDMVRQACANERTAASVRELEAAQRQLETALNSLGPSLEKLYGSLDDGQKKELDAFKGQVETWLKDIWRDFALNFDLRTERQPPNARDQFRFCIEGFCLSMPQQWPDDRRDYRPRGRDEFRL
jgi:hypothetical protein